ncbi:MAG: restriction endonuclease subunit S [Gammaproteobacteria bacterium]|nr:restriction endonuclease subunit S [Gammaproteobacteria bacterium]
MRDSDVREVRFRYLAEVEKGRLARIDPSIGGSKAPYLTMDYLRGERIEPTLVVVDPDAVTASEKSLILLWDGANAGEFLTGKHGVVASTSALVTPIDVDARFLFWTCKAQEWLLQAETIGMGIPHVNGEVLANLRLSVPPSNMQSAIADYLDQKTSGLDSLVATKELVRNLLAEKRQAIITRAVTCGLDSRTAFRDSGAPWLGAIPKNWRTERAAWLFRERDERGEPDLPLLEVSIKDGVVAREFSQERIETTAADFNTYKIARQGDVVFNKMRMWQGAAGIAPRDGLVSPDYVVAAVTGELSPAYVGLLIRTGAFSAECARRSHGIVWDRLRLYWGGFREIQLPVPPSDIQQEIVNHVAHATARLDALAIALERTILLLKERRAALISEAVSGRLDVDRAA